MSDRPTPETDAFIERNMAHGPTGWEWRVYSRRLERERDEWYHKAHVNGAFTFEARAERDEARKERDEAREKYCEVLTDNMLHIATITRLERERDEAIKRSAKLADQLLTEIKNDAK